MICTLESADHLGEIIISEPECRPFRYVQFTVFGVNNDKYDEPVFLFQDDENDPVSDIINNLEKGLKYFTAKQ